jgi:hypothetical protein
MLTLEPLQPSQYRQVAEWEYGPLPENVDWTRYEAEMSAPQWAHFGIYSGADFVGCVSFERISRNMAEYHVVTARRKVHPQDLADALLISAGYLFRHGFVALTASIPVEKRAAARLAIRCGMREWGHTPKMRFFILTKDRFNRSQINGRVEAEANSDAIPAAAD